MITTYVVHVRQSVRVSGDIVSVRLASLRPLVMIRFAWEKKKLNGVFSSSDNTRADGRRDSSATLFLFIGDCEDRIGDRKINESFSEILSESKHTKKKKRN